MEQARNSLLEKGWIHVHHYWKNLETPEIEYDKTWKDVVDWLVPLDIEVRNRVEEELSLRQIKIKNGAYIIHWGSRGEYTFKVKDVYIRAVDLLEMDKRKDWKHIWKHGIFPKIETFLWLILTRNVLTQDKLRKRGYKGHSICMFC